MSIRKLVGETAIYGLSSILGRALYFLLTPLYTRLFAKAEYGIVSDVFAYTAILMVFFTYRMETAYFRYGSDSDENARRYFDTAMLSIIGSTLLFAGIFLALAPDLAAWFRYPERSDLIVIAVLIVSLDALSEIPLSRLRLESRPIRFAIVRLSSISVNIGLNLFFLVFAPYALARPEWAFMHSFLEWVYDPDFGIGYIFLSNLVASLLMVIMLSPYIFRIRLQFDWARWRQMLIYAAPLMVVGFSYVINEVLDRKLLTILLPGTAEENLAQLGVYGANYKLAMLITLFIQAYRYGAEPFFFKQRSSENAPQLYADLARFFAAAGGLAFLFITLFIDFNRYFIDQPYWEGLGVVPILAMANIFLGLYYNFAVWYKLADLTRWGAYIAVGGALVTIILNFWWIPIFGYMGSAWTTLICYAGMAAVTLIIGRRFYPIPYSVWHMLTYLVVATAFWVCSTWLRVQWPEELLLRTVLNVVLLVVYLLVIFRAEREQIRRYFGV